MNRKHRFDRKFIKRLVSIATAFALLLNSPFLYEFSELFGLDKTVITAHAISDIDPDPTINNIVELIDYSEIYSQYPENHQFDTVTFALTGDVGVNFKDFISIGTEMYPFGGKIVINTLSSDAMNLDTAFFDYVYDYAEIENKEGRLFTIANTSDVTTGAIFANHVVHDDGTPHTNFNGESYAYPDDSAEHQNGKTIKNYSTWTLRTADYSSTPHKHGALIGDIHADAKVTINLTNNATGVIESTGNTGLICGTMDLNSKITVASISGTAATQVNSTGGHAGGLVGEMKSSSVLDITGSPSSYIVPASSINANADGKYAGGLVGYNDSAEIVSEGFTAITGTITGKAGAGGVYGYFKPVLTNGSFAFDTDKYQIGSSASSRCTVSSPTAAGGFFGVLENSGVDNSAAGTITISGKTNTIYSKGQTNGTVFGGIIGVYKASSLADVLEISGVTEIDEETEESTTTVLSVNTARSNDTSLYGGIIGHVDETNPAFVSISDVNVTSANSDREFYGGLIAEINTGYLYANNIKLTTSSNYNGGAVVGRTSNGVIHLAGSLDISDAASNSGKNYGQIVGYRDSALVFADSTWNLTRSNADPSADDIGTWGEVVRFKASDFTVGTVLDTYYDSSAGSPVHYATVKGATFTESDDLIELSSKSTFAAAALNMQLNEGQTDGVLRFTDTTNSKYSDLTTKNIVMTDSIDLNHTGMTGLTRDNAAVKENGIGPVYSGSQFDGGEYTLTLAIGAEYHGNDSTAPSNSATGKGKIYYHRYNGLFGETSESITIKDVTISGRVHTYDKAGKDNEYYVGTVIGNAAGSVTVSGVTVDSYTSIVSGTGSADDVLNVGGLIGKMSAPGTSRIGAEEATGTTDSTFSATILCSAGNGKAYIGGVCGYVSDGGSITVNDISISGQVSNLSERADQNIGGLFAVIADGTNTLSLNGVDISSLAVKGNMASGGSMGGLLGYSWGGMTATFDNIDVSNSVLNNDSTSGNQAALVYEGSGYWKFNSVEIDGLTLSGKEARSLGMLLNKAYVGAKSMYLELPSGFTYTIGNVTNSSYTEEVESEEEGEEPTQVNKSVVGTSTVYDEIAAFSVMPKNNIEANGNSVISISTNGTTIYGQMTSTADTNDDDTAVHMTSGLCNTYQNQIIDTGFNKYNPNSRYYYNVDNYIGEENSGAAALYLWSVYQYAHSSIQKKIASTAPSSSFSGDLDLDGYSYYPVDVSDTVNIQGDVKLHNEEIERKESASSGGNDEFARTTLHTKKTQHYLMHAGLFRNVSGTININGALSFDGTIPDVNTYCGALICGNITGTTSKDATITSNNEGASISLTGIAVHNKDATYSPLLINKAGGYVVMNIYHVSADSSKYSTDAEIATSLIGSVGSDTAEKVRVTFSDIKLDGRTPANANESGLTSVYGTSRSLFTRATLLESLSYATGTGSSGVYNYEYSEDWGGKPDRNVTYGKEISDNSSINKGKEYYYYKKFLDNSFFTNPYQDSNVAARTSVYDFSGFRPYVAVWGTQIGTSSTKHQLDVNHSAATFSGCGTYNDPFIIAYNSENTANPDKSGGLETIAKIISKTNLPENGYTISLPDDISTPDTWCENKDECSVYTFNGTNTFTHPTDSSLNKSLDDVRKYLAGAYYYLSTDIEIGSGFGGLGVKYSSDTSDFAVFHGVIAGNGKTITNKTQSPLIYASSGCVIKNLTIKPVYDSSLSVKTDNSFSANGGAAAYGTLIGRVMGGDNIIDQVTVDTTGFTISAGNYRATVGSYVGVVVEGGVFFRNMDKVKNNILFSGDIFEESDKGHLYCNPYIGRVINGFAINETAPDTDPDDPVDTYAPYENGKREFGDTSTVTGNQVSLQNGNKNYSITDIDPDLADLSVSGTTINVPNSQAFFVMSLIINSGIGTNESHVVGYYDDHQITRHADYNHIGTNRKISDYEGEGISQDEAEAAFKATADYMDYYKTLSDTKSTPYLISNYATNDAKQLGSKTGFKLNVNDDLILPDGYKGIGNIFTNDPNLQLSLSTFDGKEHTISQNTTFYSYTKESSLNQDNYRPYEENTVHGLGLFNFTGNASFSDCILTGNVITRQYNNGSAVNHVNEQDYSGLSAAMLIGTLNMSGTATITDIYLQNIKVESARDAAGMVGYLISDSKTNKISITNTADNDNQSEKIWISGGTCAAGLISRQGKASAQGNGGVGDISIEFNNHHFDFNSIISRFDGVITSDNDKWNSEWALGVGGIIGPARCNDSGSNANTISIDKVIIGNDSTDISTRVVACQYGETGSETQGQLYVGGLAGIANRAPVTVTNCKVYNVTVNSQKYSGGVLGWGGTSSAVTFTNCTIENNYSAKIYTSGTEGKAGCVVGFCKGDMGSITLKNSTIDGYAIEANDAGAVLGDWQANGTFSIVDSVIKDCNVTYLNAGGGIAGKLQKSLSGYNVRISGITFTKSGDAETTYEGYLVGNRTNTAVIKFVGLHRTGNISQAKLVGNAASDTMPNLYGTGGYVIFADFEGKSALTTPQNTSISSINLKGDARVTGFGALPYVTINPSITVANNIGLITGDGMSTTAINSILTDTSSRKYTVADLSYFINSSDSSIKSDIVSSFKTELGDTVKDVGYDFPVLVVNNTITADTVINNYLRVLTNTSDTIDFSQRNSDQVSKVGINGTYSTNNATVTIKKCTYRNGVITISSSFKDASLDFDSSTGNFVIRKVNGKEQYDTATEGQFTLLDIAFKDPTTSSSPKIVYHLYVPVIVKKLLEYNFDISSSSGTNYDRTIYDSSYGNVLVENLGTPVTMGFRYTYLRTDAEWTEEGGAYNYPKKLEFKVTGTSFNTSSTKMVLVDASRNGKEYYLDSLSTSGAYVLKAGTTDTYVLDLSKFKDPEGNYFEPLDFDKLPRETLTFNDSTTATYKTERYYLSIFTDAVANSAGNFYVTSQDLTLDGYPSRRVECECVGKGSREQHYNTNLILGDFYSHSLTVTAQTSDQKMDISNSEIVADLSDTISLNENTDDIITPFLNNTSVTIYQTMLVTLEKYNSDSVKTGQGVRYLNEASINSYNIVHSAGTKTINEAPIPNSNYVELPNNTDIRGYLKNGSVTISANVTLKYYDESNRNAEFPYKDELDDSDRAGAIVKGYSSISSKAETAAYSNAAESEKDTSKRYYVATDASATLNYNASYPSDRSEDNQLGINALEETGAPSIQTIGIYDISKFAVNADDYGYILCEITLSQKDKNSEGYNDIDEISDYLTGFTICGKGSVGGAVKYMAASSGDTYTFILDKSMVDNELSENVYSIPIGFQVYTGNNNSFEKKAGGGLQYGNYKVTLSTTLLSDWKEENGTLTCSTNLKSQAYDYVIYTNAKVYTDLIK